MTENEIAVIGGAGFLGTRLATRFNETGTNYTRCDIDVSNRSSKIIYIDVE